MLGWIIPVAQYVLVIATGCLLVAAVFGLLEACQKKDAKIWWSGTGKWSDTAEHWQGANEAHQNDKGGK